MGKEIERKFLFKEGYDYSEIIRYDGHEHIADYYFNETTRLRTINNCKNETKQYITIKSIGMLERDEYEYEIKPTYKLPKPLLIKDRYYIPYEGHTFELNVYDNYLKSPEINGRLIMIEVELQNGDEEIKLPEWIGKEVTMNPFFYNYNLFKLFVGYKS